MLAIAQYSSFPNSKTRSVCHWFPLLQASNQDVSGTTSATQPVASTKKSHVLWPIKYQGQRPGYRVTMLLTLSSESVRNTIFTNETGQVLYKTSHPFKYLGTTTIHKVVPNEDPMDMRDQLDVMGEIEWHFLSATLRVNGKELQSNEFIPKHGISGRKRTFTGPDGLPYRWDLLHRVVVLSRDDESNTEVARYHRGSLSITGPKTKPRLDIDPDMTHMLDLIIVTFVYVEKIRMAKEKAG